MRTDHIIRTGAGCAVLAVAALVSSGCTSATSAPSKPSHASTAGSRSEHASTTACQPATLKVRDHRRLTVLSGEDYTLPPGSKVVFRGGLPTLHTVHATLTDPHLASSVHDLVDLHWHTTTARFGTNSVAAEKKLTTRVVNNSKVNQSYAVFRTSHVYFGSYSRACHDTTIRGTYRTFGPITSSAISCSAKPSGPLGRIARRQFCH